MIILDNYTHQIEEFIQNSIERFKIEKGVPNSIGIYCCPWSGWVTTNINLGKTLEETDNNCPDFEFVEFDLLELPEWEEEYGNDNPVFESNGLTMKFNHDLGDEIFNEAIFNFLIPIIYRIKGKNNCEFLFQMLDSSFVKSI